MYLDTLTIAGYKNLEQINITLSPSLNCMVGANGSGKTNLLDAVFYLSMTKSAVTPLDLTCVNFDSEFFIVKGSYRILDNQHEQITASYDRRAGKNIMRSGKRYERLSEHIGRLPVVMVCPQDVALVAESANERRRFLNLFISQIDPTYLNLMVRYNTLLDSRNKLLKSPDKQIEVIDILSEQLAEKGDSISLLRAQLIEEFAPMVASLYAQISGRKEVVELHYCSQLTQKPMMELLKDNLSRDMIIGHTSVGVHRDDISLLMGGYPIRNNGSQGQQKSLLIALKLAQAQIIAQRLGRKAILLLDDVFDKLDMSRVENLVEVVATEQFGQIFITDSNKVRLETIVRRFADHYKMFEIEAGGVR